MPRKPIRRRPGFNSLPVTFSPFGRLHARNSLTTSMVQYQENNSKLKENSPPDTEENGLLKQKLKEKSLLSESFGEEESSDEEVSDGDVQADFSFFDPKPDDFHGVKTLLQTYLDDKEWHLSDFVDLILEQTTVGTVIKLEDDEDNNVFSVITALNLRRYKDHKCFKELNEYLLQVCRDKDLTANLRTILEDPVQNVGLLVSQRVVNLPFQLLPPLYDSLYDEVSWATEDEPTKELRNSFHFNHYIVISKIYKLKNAGRTGKRPITIGQGEEIIYVKPEDEIFQKLSSWFFSFPLNSQQHGAQKLKNYQPMGLVMAIKSDKISTFRQQLHSLIDES